MSKEIKKDMILEWFLDQPEGFEITIRYLGKFLPQKLGITKNQLIVYLRELRSEKRINVTRYRKFNKNSYILITYHL